jgi:two-component system OmpR family response regulator
MESTPHIAIVDDHKDIRELVGRYLGQHGCRVSAADSAATLRHLLQRSAPDLVVLDVMMPGEDGLSVCRYLRATSNLPVILLTAAAEETDRIIGLEIGADDYVTKPVEPRELLARIKARLRKPRPDAKPQPSAFEHCGVRIDRESRDVTFEGKTVDLTRMEFGLLLLLVENPGRVFSREELLNRVWGYERTPTTRTVDTHVVQLRTKLRADLIESVRGIGYRLVKDLTEGER